MRRAARVTMRTVAAMLILVIIAVTVFTQTDIGRERVRRFIVGALQPSLNGTLHVGRIDGNVLHGMTLHDVSIIDSTGAPFLQAAAVTIGYRLADLLSERIDFRDVTLDAPIIVLERPPGGRWNYQRILRLDATGVSLPPTGFGAWVELQDVTIRGGTVLVRASWTPDTALSAAARDSIVRAIHAGTTRAHIVEVPGGYQMLQEFRDLNAHLPHVHWAHPGTAAIKVFEVASATLIAQPMNPPVVEVRNIAGTFRVDADSVWWKGARVDLSATNTLGDGAYDFVSGDMWMAMHSDALSTADVRWVHPPLPSNGTGSADFSMRWHGREQQYEVQQGTLRVDGGTITGNFGITMGRSISFQRTALRFERIRTQFLERLPPGVKIPRPGLVSGRLTMDGPIEMLTGEGDITFDDPLSGTNRVVFAGAAGMTAQGYDARDLHLTFTPVQVALAGAMRPDLPFKGVLTGTATVSGSTATRIDATVDLTHTDADRQSRVTGTGFAELAGERRIEFDGALAPLSLLTAGAMAPSAGLRGSVSGPVHLSGTQGALQVRSELAVSDGGAITVKGTMDLASAAFGYDLAVDARLFDAAAILETAPHSTLTMRATARGRGVDLATMDAALTGDFSTSIYRQYSIDSGHVALRVADGMATVDTLLVHAPSTHADAHGTFGLVEGKRGELSYRVAIDSLGALAAWLPSPDSGLVLPRPRKNAIALAQARLDSARRARATEVERMVTGGPPPKLVVDTTAAMRSDSLSGRIAAEGTISGNVKAIDAKGVATVERLAVYGNGVPAARVEYSWTGPYIFDQATIGVSAHATGVTASGFAFDTVDAKIKYTGAQGDFDIALHQANIEEYRLAGEFDLRLDARELRFRDLSVRFDTTTWRATQPALVRWSPRGIERIDADLTDGRAGRIMAKGSLTTGADADLSLELQSFQLGHLAALAQSDIDARGLLTLEGHVRGAPAARALTLSASLADGQYLGTALPLLTAKATSQGETLTAHVEASASGAPPSAVADAVIPFALSPGAKESYFPDGPITVDVSADSLALMSLPPIAGIVEPLGGHAIGRLEVRGTRSDPHVEGTLRLVDASMRFVMPGAVIEHATGSLRMAGDSVTIDSLVAASKGGGGLRLSGGIGIKTLTTPTFDLHLTADDAILLDNEYGTLSANAKLDMVGPLDAVHITGRTDVRSGIVYLPKPSNKRIAESTDPVFLQFAESLGGRDAELVPRTSPLMRGLKLDVDVSVARGTWMRSREANIELYSDGDLTVHVDRAKEEMSIAGFLSTERGQYTYLSKRFEVKRGTVTFIGEETALDPTLQITAEHEVQLPASDVLVVRVLIGGTLNHLRLSLESDAQPPLSDSELLSFLAFGKSSSSLLQLGGSGVTGQGNLVGGLQGLSAFAGQSLAGIALGVLVDDFEGQAARSTGVDVFNITPADAYTELAQRRNVGSFLRLTEFEIGKYVTPRTFVAGQLRLTNPKDAPPGIRIQHRAAAGYRIEATFEPRFEPRAPSLTTQIATTKPIFGLFLIREWRY